VFTRPDLGWGPYAAAGVDVHHIPGTHLGLIEPPDVAALAQSLYSVLNEPEPPPVPLAAASENLS
jgi:aspartate racemase